jgi:hypothetical protein
MGGVKIMKRMRLIGETFDTNVAKERYGGTGRTLGGYLAKTVNGVDLPLDDPYGEIHLISLAPFADEDPNRFLMFTFIESREDGSGLDERVYEDAVMLKEYNLLPPE